MLKTIIKFEKEIAFLCGDEEFSIIPNSEYEIKETKIKGYEGWVIICGLFRLIKKSGYCGSALSFSPFEYDNLLKKYKSN